MMPQPMPDDQVIEQAVGDIAAALYRMAQRDPRTAFDSAGAVLHILSGFRLDLLKSKMVKP